MKVVVTGGAGFIGSNLTKLLLDKGHQVVVVDDFTIGSKDNLPKSNDLEVVEGDVCNQQLMIKVTAGVDLVFHLAVQNVRKSINDPWIVHQVNVGGTLSVLEAARQNNVGKFVYISSSEVYGTAVDVPMTEEHPLNPTTIYGASKLAGEYYTLAYFRTHRLPAVIVRPFNTYGYNEHFEGPYGEVIPRFVVRALNNLPLQIFGDGEQTRDFTFVDDTVLGMLQVSDKGKLGQIYNIARGEEVTINKLADQVLKALNVEGEVEHLDSRPGDVLRLYADTSKAQKELGFESKVDLAEGLKKYIAWFKETIPDASEALKFYTQENW